MAVHAVEIQPRAACGGKERREARLRQQLDVLRVVVRLGRHGDDDEAPRDAQGLPDGGLRLRHVLEHLKQHHDVRAARLELQRREIPAQRAEPRHAARGEPPPELRPVRQEIHRRRPRVRELGKKRHEKGPTPAAHVHQPVKVQSAQETEDLLHPGQEGLRALEGVQLQPRGCPGAGQGSKFPHA